MAGLVKQLGSNDFAEREAAGRRLATLNVDEVPPELLAALESPSPEVRERAGKAVRALREHIALMRLPRGERFARLGQIDLYVASSAAWEAEADDRRIWDPLHSLAKDLVKKGGPRDISGLVNYRNLAVFQQQYRSCRFIKTHEMYRRTNERDGRGNVIWAYPGGILAPEVDEPWAVGHNLIVSRGGVRARACISDSIVFANGRVAAGTHLASSVVVCDGNVETPDRILGCLVVARGDITVGQLVSTSTLIAAGDITVGDTALDSTLIAGGKITIKNMERNPRLVSRVRESEARPFGFVTFFELSRVGVEVQAVDKVVTVAAVAHGKAMGEAGVRVGDVINGVNGKKPDTAESLRRLLRDALALGDATVTLRRGGADVTVKVALPE